MNNYKPIRLELIVDNKVEYSKLHSEDELKKEIERLKNFVSRTGYIESFELVIIRQSKMRKEGSGRKKKYKTSPSYGSMSKKISLNRNVVTAWDGA